MTYDTKTLQLSYGQYIDEPQDKNLIVLHHTVGGSARSTFDYWNRSPERIATAFIIDRDGSIYQTFDPSRWAYHLGLKGADAAGGKHERRSIGIEIASEGALLESGGNLYCFDTVSPRTLFDRSKAVDLGYAWRGRRWFDAYEPEQITAVTELIETLLGVFTSIPRKTVRDHKVGPAMTKIVLPSDPYADRLSFRGVLCHADLRDDKTDTHPKFPWSDLARALDLEVVT